MTPIPVRTAAGHVRFVTDRQTAAEVAGKVLARHPTLWRKATKEVDPVTGLYWMVHYFTPTDQQVKDWENRTRSNTARTEFAH